MSSLRPEAFESVTHAFFEAAAVPSLWPGALHALALACNAEGAAAHSADGVRTIGTVFSEATARLHYDFVTRWRAPELNSHRSRGLALLDRGWRGALTENDIFTPAEIARDPFHQEFIIPSGFASFAGLVLAKAPNLMLSASIYRRPTQGHYERSEIELINKLVTHLRAAGRVAMRIGMSATLRMTEAFTASGQPVALIGRDGRVVHMSAPFERLVRDGIHVKRGRLGCWQPEADRDLRVAIDRAATYDGIVREPSASIILPRRNGLRPLIADVIPVLGAAQDIFHLVSALAILTDLEAANFNPAETALQRAFGLTPAEARLAAQIATGRTLPEIALTERTARETLRSRLKAIFDKTGTGRQTELALLLSRFANVRS
jgi:DNA-binding CsgD family transcriptional regulator